MSRIAARFERLKAAGRKGFIPFVTAGDPDLSTSLSIVLKLCVRGAVIIELGVPFSDPMADGPVIQRSSQRAVDNGTTLRDVLSLASQIRKTSDVPLVLFSYFNPILSFGLDNFYRVAAEAGIDGVLLTDVIDEEAAVLSKDLADVGVDLISLVSPTTTDARLQNICSQARGFIYAVSRNGTTGQQAETSSIAEELVRRTRQCTDLPVAVGFGISSRQQIEDVWQYADAAVVGSAIVNEMEKADDPSDAVARVDLFIGQLLPQVAKKGVEN
jgi:tryptophan synthase alpha chain